ncbi:MAG: acyltransferase [Alphaproteobacteria bacterium]|nr:acyltransferase [Alphaproteobacteria bacterium]MBV9371991.1 acyltransferase [Alphaproteobacteria bacterium]MBV9902624.1 acyltransferase [Alphaproteobacteria bacterium]
MATAPNAARKAALDSLQAGRGLAAMAVVCHHADTYVSQQVGPLPGALSAAMAYGYLGVDFFFVLSGFIIYFTNRDRTGRPGWPKDYAESRLTRIFIPYLPIGIALALVYTYLPQIGHGEQAWNWFSTLTLLPSGAEPSLHVAWTLQHELVFYALAFLMLWSGRVLLGALGWAAVLLALLPLRFMLQPGVSPIDLEFLFGIAVAWCFMEGRVRRHLPLVLGGLACVAAFFALGGDRYYSPLFGLGLALLLLPLVRREAEGRLGIPRWLVLLGNASYAIYLIHVPLLSVVVRVCRGFPPLAALAVGIAAAAVAGILYHKIYEVPALRLARRLVGYRPARSVVEER